MIATPTVLACPLSVECSPEFIRDPDNQSTVHLAVSMYGTKWLPAELQGQFASATEETSTRRSTMSSIEEICRDWYRRDKDASSNTMNAVIGYTSTVIGAAVGLILTRNAVGGIVGAAVGLSYGIGLTAAYNASTPDSCPTQ